jgi:hypothetical protein
VAGAAAGGAQRDGGGGGTFNLYIGSSVRAGIPLSISRTTRKNSSLQDRPQGRRFNEIRVY